MNEVIFEKVTLIGLGLIGSSIARAMRKHGLAQKIVGVTRSVQTLELARSCNICDELYQDAGQAVRGADLVILCTPVGAIGTIMRNISPFLKRGVIISDVGSVKKAVVDSILPHLPETATLVPAHPIAGTEYSGPEAGFATLFQDRWCILTPVPEAQPQDVRKVRKLWEMMGSHVELMTPAHHDRVLAVTSHLPHLIAYTIVGTANDLETVTKSEVIKYSASGFRDFTRIASSDPTMWRDVFLHNKDAVLELLGRFTEDLIAMQRAIRWEDGEVLFDAFTRTKAVRQEIIDAGQDTPDANFGRKHSSFSQDNNQI